MLPSTTRPRTGSGRARGTHRPASSPRGSTAAVARPFAWPSTAESHSPSLPPPELGRCTLSSLRGEPPHADEKVPVRKLSAPVAHRSEPTTWPYAPVSPSDSGSGRRLVRHVGRQQRGSVDRTLA